MLKFRDFSYVKHIFAHVRTLVATFPHYLLRRSQLAKKERESEGKKLDVVEVQHWLKKKKKPCVEIFPPPPTTLKGGCQFVHPTHRVPVGENDDTFFSMHTHMGEVSIIAVVAAAAPFLFNK